MLFAAELAPLIDLHGVPERLLAKQGSTFATLAKSIIFQQLATKAAATIYGRVLAACCVSALHATNWAFSRIRGFA